MHCCMHAKFRPKNEGLTLISDIQHDTMMLPKWEGWELFFFQVQFSCGFRDLHAFPEGGK